MASYVANDVPLASLHLADSVAGCIQVRDGSDLRIVVGSYVGTDVAGAPETYLRASGLPVTASLPPPNLSLYRTVPGMIATNGAPDIYLIEDK